MLLMDEGDHAGARLYYERAADQGEFAAQCNLALMLHKGEGAPKDWIKARHLYELAAAQGDHVAAGNMRVLNKEMSAYASKGIHFPGKILRVHGLQSKPEYNGKTAQVVDWDGRKGRYAVHLNGPEGTTISLKPGNLLDPDAPEEV